MVLEQFPEILDDELRCTRILVLLEPLVDTDDVHQFVSEIILGALSILKDNGRPHSDRGNRQHGKNRPLRTGNFRIDPEMLEVFIGYLLKPCPDISRG